MVRPRLPLPLGGRVSMFNIYDPPALGANTRPPFSLSYSCRAGYFISLLNGGVAAPGPPLLLLKPGRGSVADLSPSGQHVARDALLTLDEAMVLTIFRDRIRTVGDAVNQAKLY